MVIRLALAASLYNELMTIIFLFNEWGQLLATLKYSDVMLIFFIFIVNFNMNLINRIDYKYKRNKHCVTIFKKKKKDYKYKIQLLMASRIPYNPWYALLFPARWIIEHLRCIIGDSN